MQLNKAVWETTERINCLLKERDKIIVAVDGRCASGKTSFAQMLKGIFDCSVIHMDDFFLRKEQRTEERRNEAGGNVDRERFLEEVLLPLSKGENFFYRPFNCKTMTLDEPVFTESNRVTVVEGSYSCHPDLWDYYDLHIFLSTDEKTQSKRILIRNGETAYENFKKLWIPLEEKYFEFCQTDKKCELYFET